MPARQARSVSAVTNAARPKLSGGTATILDVEPGDWIALATLVLVPVGFFVTWLVYNHERCDGKRRDLDDAVSVLRAFRDGIMPWGELYFCQGYDYDSAKKRAQRDYDWIMTDKSYGEIFHVPADPLVAFLGHPAAGGLIGKDTLEAASVALWRIGIFNQLVRQRSDFNGRQLVEIRDHDLPPSRRRALADASFSHSVMLHANGVGDATWWTNLKQQLQINIEALLESRC